MTMPIHSRVHRRYWTRPQIQPTLTGKPPRCANSRGRDRHLLRRCRYGTGYQPRYAVTQTSRQVQENQDAPTALYRLYSETGKLLYVGISKHPGWRMVEHSNSKWWWWQVASNRVEWFSDRVQASRAEMDAIKTEAPIYNLAGRVDQRVQTHHGLWCPQCWEHGSAVGVEPWDDVPDHASWTWVAAYSCPRCDMDWSVAWDYYSGERLEHEVYDPWAVYA